MARRHFLVEATARRVADVAHAVVGLHATDPATPYLSLWARCAGFRVADLDAALYQDRSVVKHLAMRRTLWVFDVADLPAVQSAASDRVAGNERRKVIADVVKAGITVDGDTWLDEASTAVLAHLDEHGHANARELREALPQLAGTYDPAPGKSWGGAGPISPRVLTVLGVQGQMVGRGPNEGAWTTSRPRWTASSHWLGASIEPMEHDTARAVLVAQWLRTFGPATVNDVKWWFGHTLTWARAALQEVGAVEVDLGGAPGYVLPDDLEPEPSCGRWCALLPGLDVTTMGWQDRDWYLGGAQGPGVRPQRQRRTDGVVRRSHRGRLGSGRRGTRRAATRGERRRRGVEDVGAQGERADRLARRGADRGPLPLPLVEAAVEDG